MLESVAVPGRVGIEECSLNSVAVPGRVGIEECWILLLYLVE